MTKPNHSTRQVRSEFGDSTPVPVSILEAAGLSSCVSSSSNESVEDALIAAIDRQRGLATLLPYQREGLQRADRRLRALAARTKSPATRAWALAGAKRIADAFLKDDRRRGRAAAKFAESVASQIGIAKRSIERAVTLGAKLLPDLVQTIAGGPHDTSANLEMLASLSPELQLKFAQEAVRRKVEGEIAQRIAGDGRLKKLDHAVLDDLDVLGLNDPQTRRRLAAMTKQEAIDTVAQMKRDAEAAERREATVARLREMARAPLLTAAADGLGVAFAAATRADRERFMEIHGLRRAQLIPGEDVGLLFGCVESEV
ncbi:MAG: hypothetical protein Q7V17_13750 [Afipia sp.]|nr:hypothetical protein [Afipia sp.]